MQNLSRRFHNTIKQKAAKKKLTIDNVSDISRILRPVGTINNKPNCTPVKVTAIKTGGPRYNPEDFEQLLIDYEPAESAGPSQKTININNKELKEITNTLVFNANASPPLEEFAELSNLFTPVFWETWEKKRTDLNDKSASGYCMSLANYAVRAGWSDQEIVNLFIAFRRKHGHKLDLDKRQKHIKTILKARETAQTEKNKETIAIASTLAGTAYATTETIIDGIKALLGVTILKIIKHIGDETEYEVIVETECNKKKETRSAYMSDKELLNFRSFESKMLTACTVIINPCSKKDWHKAKLLLVKLIEERIISKHDGFAGEVFQWIGEYLDGEQSRSPDLVVTTKKPFFDISDNAWFIDLNKFIEWASELKRLKRPKKEVIKAFGKIGLNNDKRFYVVKKNGRRTSMRPWKVPDDVADPPIMQNESKMPDQSNVIKLQQEF